MSIQAISDEALVVRRFAKGQMIYNQGSLALYYYEVKSGQVRIVNTNEEGKDFVQGLYKAGDCIGLPSLVCEKPYPAAAFAHSSSELYVVARKQFFELLKGNPEFHFGITKTLSERLLYKAMMLEEVAIEEAEHRLITLIHYLIRQKEGADNILGITKQRLADLSGLRVETVIRILKKVEERGLIETHRGNIIYKGDLK